MRKLVIILVIALIATSCNKKSLQPENCFFKEKDSYGRVITLEAEPQRIVSLTPAITEITFLLHEEKKLVGVTDFCTYPPAAQKLPKVGKLLNINIETILAQRPDLVIIGSVVAKKDVLKMERAGIPVFSIKEEKSVEDLFSTIKMLGKLLNQSAAADSLIKNYQLDLQEIENQTFSNRPSVYYVVGFGESGDFTAPGNSFINDIIQMAGGQNIGESLRTWNVSREFLFEQDPDFIFIREEDCTQFCRTEPYTQLNAVRDHRVFPIPSGWMDILSPRNLQAVAFIHEKITPSPTH